MRFGAERCTDMAIRLAAPLHSRLLCLSPTCAYLHSLRHDDGLYTVAGLIYAIDLFDFCSLDNRGGLDAVLRECRGGLP
ncbi:unnamed protein product [Protopolystoma xenopodis]|uniref:Uncharacterized protein n=1 Tax=Protopolystoma xenopodis TaxID=117903 RepID=A0A448XTA1_9PLAT|nr:unnamed protein product [Protopolystoma xenopodis]